MHLLGSVLGADRHPPILVARAQGDLTRRGWSWPGPVMTDTGRVHLVRVQLPDRPGSLGMVASAMGECGADISAIEIIQKNDGSVIDDFMLALPPEVLVDELVSSCNVLDGVRVMWVSRYPDSWGLEGDIEVLDRMLADPDNAIEILTTAAPVVFHSQWAALVDRHTGCLLLGTEQAPDLGPDTAELLGDLSELHRRELPAGWKPMWGDHEVAICPVDDDRTLVLGRLGGPPYLHTSLRRMAHLALLSTAAVPARTQQASEH